MHEQNHDFLHNKRDCPRIKGSEKAKESIKQARVVGWYVLENAVPLHVALSIELLFFWPEIDVAGVCAAQETMAVWPDCFEMRALA